MIAQILQYYYNSAACYMVYQINEIKTSQNSMITSQNDMITSLNEWNTSQNERNTSQNEMITSQNEMITSQNERNTSQNERNTSQNEMITSQNETTTSQNEMTTSQKEMMTSQKEIMASQKEMITSQKEMITSQKEMVASLKEMTTLLKKTEEKNDAMYEEMKYLLFGEFQGQLAKESNVNIENNDGYIGCLGNIVKLGSNYFASTTKLCTDSKKLNGIPLISNDSQQISIEDHYYKHDTHDLALIPILQEKNPNINMSKIAVQVSEEPAEIFQKLRGISYSNGKLRGFSGEVVYDKNHQNQLQIETYVKEGDSGAGLFYGKKLQAILCGSMQMNQDELSSEYEDIFQKMQEQEQNKGKFKNLLKNDLQEMNIDQKRDVKEYIDKKRDIHRSISEDFFVGAESAHYLHEIPVNQEQAKNYF